MELFKDGRTYRFRISNVGEADAANVSMRLLLQREGDNPIIASEYADKFPVKRLASGASLTLIAAIHLGGPSAYNAEVSWTNPDGSHATEEVFVSL